MQQVAGRYYRPVGAYLSIWPLAAFLVVLNCYCRDIEVPGPDFGVHPLVVIGCAWKRWIFPQRPLKPPGPGDKLCRLLGNASLDAYYRRFFSPLRNRWLRGVSSRYWEVWCAGVLVWRARHAAPYYSVFVAAAHAVLGPGTVPLGNRSPSGGVIFPSARRWGAGISTAAHAVFSTPGFRRPKHGGRLGFVVGFVTQGANNPLAFAVGGRGLPVAARCGCRRPSGPPAPSTPPRHRRNLKFSLSLSLLSRKKTGEAIKIVLVQAEMIFFAMAMIGQNQGSLGAGLCAGRLTSTIVFFLIFGRIWG